MEPSSSNFRLVSLSFETYKSSSRRRFALQSDIDGKRSPRRLARSPPGRGEKKFSKKIGKRRTRNDGGHRCARENRSEVNPEEPCNLAATLAQSEFMLILVCSKERIEAFLDVETETSS